MQEARAGASCVALEDGKVLVLGGSDGNSDLNTGEIFDATANAWSSAGSMAVARSGHTATRTPWGSVLIVGGSSNGVATESVELFLPATGEFRKVGNLSSARSDYAMAVLPNQRVLIAGGANGAGALNTIDIYDAAKNQITPAGTMIVARKNFAVSALLDGRVLITGGFGSDGAILASSEIYDPSDMSVVDGPQLSVSRANHQAYTLPNNGRVMLVGGTDGNVTLSSTDSYEPWSGKFVRSASMNTARTNQATSLLRRGSLIVAGGRNVSGVLAGSELYAFATVETDKSDYAPGQIARITGSGWKPGEQVQIKITAFPMDEHKTEFTASAVADGAGQFRNVNFNVDKSHFGGKFILEAAGSESQAQTFFTDADSTSISQLVATPASNTSAYGTSVTVDGFVNDNTNPCFLPVGTVQVTDNGVAAGTATTSVGNGAQCPGDAVPIRNSNTNGYFTFTFNGAATLAPGNHTLGFQYQANAGADASALTTIPYVIQPVNVTVSTPNYGSSTINYGSSTTISTTVAVSGSTWNGSPSGSVTFSDGATTIIVGGPTSTGTGTSTFTANTPTNLSAGVHNFSATFNSGSPAYNSGTSGASPLTVSAVPTSTSAPSPNPVSPITYPQTVVLQSTVTPNVGATVPTGTLSFFDNGAAIAGATGLALNGAGTATSPAITLNAGIHSLTATYTPNNTNFQGSVSGSTSYTVNAEPTVTTVTTAAPAPPAYSGGPVFGQSVTFTATVTPAAPLPVGNVTFVDSTTNTTLASNVPLNGAGQASVTTSTLSVATHTITANYSSSSANFANSSGTATYTVAKVDPIFSINLSSPTPTAGQTSTITVNATPIQGVTPTGSVTLKIVSPGGAVATIGTSALVNGSATFSYSGWVSLGGATQTMGVDYTGDATFLSELATTTNGAAQPGDQITFTVGTASTTTSVGSNPSSPLTYGNAVTFTATVTSGFNGTLTSTVSFTDNGGAIIPACTGVAITVTGTAPASGTASCTVPAPGLTVTGSPHPIRAAYNAGDANFGASTSAALNEQVNPAGSTTTVTIFSGSNTITFGATNVYQASVAINPAGAGNPPGTVSFFDNAVAIATCQNLTLSAANPGTANCSATYNGTAPLTGGSHSVTAVYASGSVNISGSNSNSTPVLVTVNKATATVGTPTSTVASPVYNQQTILRTVVTPTVAGVPVTGTVSFYDGTTLLATVGVVSGGNTDLPAAAYSVGNHTITATYNGDTNYVATTSAAFLLTVAKGATSVSTITASPASTVNFGTPITLSVTVTSTAPSSGTPTGTVVFSNNGTTIGTGNVNGAGTASITTSSLAVGTYANVIGTFSGDGNFSGSVSPSASITINPNSTTSTLTSAPNPSVYGDAVTFTVTVTANGGGSGTPGGTVDFKDGAATIAPGVALNGSGQATFTTSTLTAGVHPITAVYSGNPSFTTSTSNTINQTVNATSTTTVTITSGSNTITFGATNVYQASVAVSPGAGNPPGTVSFFDNTTAIAGCQNVALTASNPGTANCSATYNGTPPLTGGSHSVTAVYTSSSANVFGSNSNGSPVLVTVNKATPTVGTPSSTVASPVYNQQTILRTVVTPSVAGVAVTGTVSFFDGTTLLGTVGVVSGGNTDLPAAAYSVGNHTITATYNGDTNYSAGTSSAFLLTVAKGATSTALSFLPAGPNVNFGTTITFTGTVTVNGPSSGTATGTVTFKNNATIIGTGTLNGAGVATVTSNTLPVGTYSNLEAVYNGDGNLLGSTSSPDQTVNIVANSTTTTLISSQNPSSFGGSVTFTATVSPNGGGAGTPGGTVDFKDGAATIQAGVALSSAGQATFTTTTLAPGVHSITAVYSGNTSFTGSTSGAISQTVNAANTTTTLGASTSTPTLNSTVTYTVTVTPFDGAPAPATGTVTVQDAINNTVLCTVSTGGANPLVNGAGTCNVTYDASTAERSGGPHSLRAVYVSNNATNWSGSQSAVLSITVGKLTPVLQNLASSAGNSYTYGTPTTISVEVVPHSPTPAYSANIVHFTDNGVDIGTSSVNTGTGIAQITGVVFTAGTHTVGANFVGDNNYNSVQDPISVTVAKASIAAGNEAITPAFTANYAGTLSAGTVTLTAVGSGVTPTGTVTIFAAGQQIGGTINLVGGVATLTGAQLPPGLNAGAGQVLSVNYSGDSNYNAATPLPTSSSLTVNPANTTATVGPSTLPGTTIYYGQNVTFTVTLSGVSGGNNPSGAIDIRVNGFTPTGCGGVTIANGSGSCTTTATTANNFGVGPHDITAANFNAAPANYTLGSSNTLTPVTVSKDSTTTALAAVPNPSNPGQNVVLTATVTETNGVGALGGTVTFNNGSTAICPAVALSPVGSTTTATATCNFAPTAAGPYNLNAVYSGDALTATSTGTTILTVSKPVPQITLTSNSTPVPGQVNTYTSAYGASVTFTANVTVPAGGPAPTGNVQFYDASNSLGGLQALVGSCGANCYSATLTVPSGSLPVLSGGSHTITAQYVPGADPNYALGNSATQNPPVILTQIVTKQDVQFTNATVTFDNTVANAPVYGEQITFKIRVTPTTGTGVPSGSIIFRDAGNQVGPVGVLTNDVAICGAVGVPCASITTSAGSVPNLSTSAHPLLTWAYLGDTNFNAANSAAYPSLTVSAAPTKTTLGAFPASPQYGQQITLTATACATAVNPPSTACVGAPLPGLVGSITFRDGSTILGTSTVDNTGSASLQITLQNPPLAGTVVAGHSITATYNGPSGTPSDINFAASTSVAATLTVGKGSTTVTVVSSVPGGSVYGQSVTFTATVNAPSSFAAAPSGTVTFYDGGANLGTVTLVSAGATTSTASITIPQASPGIPALSVGQHIISASYSGDANYNTTATGLTPPPCSASSCAIVQNVAKAATSTTLSPSVNSSVVGQQVVLTATVLISPPGAGVPTGVVQFFNGSVSLGSANLVASGPAGSQTFTATLTIDQLPQGNLQLTAVYSGDTNFLGSTSPIVTQAVNKPEVNVQVSTNLSPSILGNPVTFTATVTPKLPGSGVPTGNVEFFDGTSLLATVQLVGGQATYTASLAVGSHAIAVSYSGDTKYQPNISPSIPQIVGKIPASINLTSSSPNSVASQAIILTAQINPAPPPNVPFASGQIAFMEGGILLGVGNLSSNVATLLISSLSAGLHQINAIYVGDGNWTNATSGFVPQTVNLAPTNIQITSSVNPSVFGQPVTFTIVVSVPFPGTVPASGQVQLYDNNNALGNPLTANNGSFTFTVPGFSPGTHNIYATFIGNLSFATATSATLTQVVNKAPTVTTLAALPNNSTSKQSVTLIAVVSVPTPGAGTPSGTVTFDNTTIGRSLGTAPLTVIGGVYTATITTDQLNQSGAPQILVATYSGDVNFATSSSNPIGQSVFGNQLAVTNAASYFTSNFAPDSIASLFSPDGNLADTVLSAQTTPLPTALGGTTVEITDAAGVKRLAQLFFVSPKQVNFLIPTNTAFGLAIVTVTNSRGATASTIILVTRTAVGIFSANASGQDTASAFVTRVSASGAQTQEAVASYDPNLQKMVPVPIDLSNASDQVYLVLYGTGIRYNPGLNTVKVTINGINIPVQYAGAQPQYVGLDQVNVGPLPASLKGAGTVNVVVTVDGQASNTTTLTFK